MDSNLFKIRPATPEDALGVAQVNIWTWQSSMIGIVDSEFLASLNAESRVEAKRKVILNPEIDAFVVEEISSGKVVAQADLGPSREKNLPYEGELYSIYVLKELQGQGIGTALFQKCVERLRERFKDFFVSAISGNENAAAFYKSQKGQLIGHDHVDLGKHRYRTDTFGWTF